MAFPQEVYQFELRTEITAVDVPYVQRFQELKLKANRTPQEETEMANLMARLRTKFISSDDWNKFQNALAEMQIFIKENVAGYIDTARDEALIAIDQKKNAIIVYLDSLEAGKLRNDLGIMDELTTVAKSSLVAAINEVNQKSSVEASTTRKGITQLNDSINSNSTSEAATPKAVKAAYDRGSDGVTAINTHVKDNTKHVPHLGTTTNTGDAYKITTSEIIGNNQKFTIKFNTASTTAPTLSINGVTADPIKKPNGNNAKLYASVYTLFKDGAAFILQGEGGDFGTAVASEVLVGKTIGTETGLVAGTMPDRTGNNIQATFDSQVTILNGRYTGTEKILPPRMTAGDYLIANRGSRTSYTGQTTLNRVFSTIMTSGGTFRVKFLLSTATEGVYAHAQVYVNGASVTSSYSSNTGGGISVTYDATVNAGDTIEVWARTTSESSYARIYEHQICGGFSFFSVVV